MDRYISLKYQGLKCARIYPENISQIDSIAAIFTVDSQTERGVKYLVNMELGICSCNTDSDGSPCSHQAAIVIFHLRTVCQLFLLNLDIF